MPAADIQLPLAPPVTLKMAFRDIFGDKQKEMPDSVRRERWARWLRIARKRKVSREGAQYWRDTEGCHEGGRCIHLRGTWCKLSSLPASVNPYLTFRHGMIGMACMGAGYEPAQQPDEGSKA